jgi:hypothetical protein
VGCLFLFFVVNKFLGCNVVSVLLLVCCAGRVGFGLPLPFLSCHHCRPIWSHSFWRRRAFSVGVYVLRLLAMVLSASARSSEVFTAE